MEDTGNSNETSKFLAPDSSDAPKPSTLGETVSMNVVAPKGVPLGHRPSAGLGHDHKFLPALFERSSKHWWNPRFDSRILEQQLASSSFNQKKWRFQISLLLLGISMLSVAVYLLLTWQQTTTPVFVVTLLLLVVTIFFFLVTFAPIYRRLWIFTSFTLVGVCAVALVLRLLLCPAVLCSLPVTEAASFVVTMVVILLTYTIVSLPLFVAFIFTAILSVVYEISFYSFSYLPTKRDGSVPGDVLTSLGITALLAVSRVLLHICIHFLGIYCHLRLQSHMRSTFWKVGLSVMDKRNLEVEKVLKENMIHSIMPPQFAKEVMKTQPDESEEHPADDEEAQHKKGSASSDGRIEFRPLNVSQLDNVSILFADIVGFTKMSSNKTAEHLVRLLNDLFGRFDRLCVETGCEKIATLGDCYYCVSGCPDRRPDHAQCCVRMGLKMIEAIKQFDEDNNEEVNMRVGVHTGTVLMGIVGKKRLKFDVWSHDVTLANEMESSGKPGLVHISEDTYNFLKDDYECEEGQLVEDTRKNRILIETYDAASQRFVAKAQDDSKQVQTYFIVKSKHPEPEPPEKTAEYQNDGAVISSSKKNDSAPVSIVPRIESDGHSNVEDLSAGALLELRKQEEAVELSVVSEANEDNDDAAAEAAAANKTASLKISAVPFGKSRKELKHWREQGDRALVEIIRSNSESTDFFQTSRVLNRLTLSFLKSDHEKKFRSEKIYPPLPEEIVTFSSLRFTIMIELVISVIFFLVISFGLFSVYGTSVPWVILFLLGIIVNAVVLAVFLIDYLLIGQWRFAGFTTTLSSWYLRHIIFSVLLLLPSVSVFSNIGNVETGNTGQILFFYYALAIALLSFSNFTSLYWCVKSLLCTLVVIVAVLLSGLYSFPVASSATNANSIDGRSTLTPIYAILPNATTTTTMPPTLSELFDAQREMLRFEMIPVLIIILLVVWLLNREYEISGRLNYHGGLRSAEDRVRMHHEKEQVDWLFSNIIPPHIVSEFTAQTFFAKNHKDVGVIFASISNFSDFYEESFKGGLGYLRVLNELIGDFEAHTDNIRFKDVEKIKTIGACFMASSGLNEQRRFENKDPDSHLYALMDFAFSLLKTIEEFNAAIFNFDFEMKIGFNAGEVTSGVIGTTKLHYDIWGDTVNVSSRMYSTGVKNHIQVPKTIADRLSDKFDFEYRGKIFVKGKGDMDTYIVKGKKPGADWS